MNLPERSYMRIKQEKALLVADVLMANGTYICCDEQQSCPLWNKDTWYCVYKRNTNTKDCPLKPLPKKQVEEKYEFGEYGKYYIDEHSTGWNDCVDEILREEH